MDENSAAAATIVMVLANPAYAAQAIELRRSGAAGRHAQGVRRRRSRSDARRAALADSWAGR